MFFCALLSLKFILKQLLFCKVTQMTSWNNQQYIFRNNSYCLKVRYLQLIFMLLIKNLMSTAKSWLVVINLFSIIRLAFSLLLNAQLFYTVEYITKNQGFYNYILCSNNMILNFFKSVGYGYFYIITAFDYLLSPSFWIKITLSLQFIPENKD